jgi:pyruvate dehydrogenase E2 component (dihydrolipoamide acetyltransferase)
VNPDLRLLAPVAAAAPAPVSGGARVFASPLARRIAKEKGLDLGAVKGSGPHGRIVRADVEGAQAAPVTACGGCPAAGCEAAAPAPAKAAMPTGMAAETVLKMYADRRVRPKWRWTACAAPSRRG